MSKIQGKQVADQTIEQKNLFLTLPGSGDTLSGATVGYVNSALVGGSAITIGPAPDGAYTDGIFTDFTSGTTIGTAVDKFNEMFLLLAPTPPNGDWTNAFTTGPVLTGLVTLNEVGTHASRNNVLTSTVTPSFTLISTVLNQAAARSKDGNFVFTIRDWNGNSLATTTINSASTTVNNGIIRYTVADTYATLGAGKEGFWTGVTTFTVNGLATTTPIPVGTTLRSLTFEHATTTNNTMNRTGTTFYVDQTALNTPTITGLTLTWPTQTKYISGVLGMAPGQSVTNVNFSVTNACTYYYPSTLWTVSGGVGGTLTGTLDSVAVLTAPGNGGVVTNKSFTVTAGNWNSLTLTVSANNRAGTSVGASGSTNSALRMDNTSVETDRLTSGTGDYPATYGSAFTSIDSLITTNSNELQLLTGLYKWPTADYTQWGGPNYSTITTGDGGGIWRWATFNVGSKGTAVSNITITLPNASVGSSYNAIKMYVKIGASGWLDATVAQALSAPYNDGDTALDVAGSTAYNVRKVTFGTIPRAGVVYVRIGIKYADRATFTFGKPTMA